MTASLLDRRLIRHPHRNTPLSSRKRRIKGRRARGARWTRPLGVGGVLIWHSQPPVVGGYLEPMFTTTAAVDLDVIAELIRQGAAAHTRPPATDG